MQHCCSLQHEYMQGVIFTEVNFPKPTDCTCMSDLH